MNQIDKAKLFQNLHVKGDPLILYNIWDAGSAGAVMKAGAKAIATGSWSVAAAWGYADGEKMPLDIVVQVTRIIVDSTDAPVTIDFEGGYDTSPELAAINVGKIIKAGAVGINFEDQIVGSDRLYSIDDQVKRIKAIRKEADEMDVPFFINSRTDCFLKESDVEKHESLMNEAQERASAYAEAGASGYFVPGLMDDDLIADMCGSISLPVNIMMKPGVSQASILSKAGVSRISHGPFPYMALMDILTTRAEQEFRDE